MGVYVVIERWGANSPVMETIRVAKDDGIEIKIPLDLFISRISKQVSENLSTEILASFSSKKIFDKIYNNTSFKSFAKSCLSATDAELSNAESGIKIAISKSEDILKSEVGKIVKEIKEATIQVADLVC